VRQVLHVFWLFIPLPVFWALYDQQVCSAAAEVVLLQDSFALQYQDDVVNMHCVSKKGPPTTNDNFNNRCRIPVIFGTNFTE